MFYRSEGGNGVSSSDVEIGVQWQSDLFEGDGALRVFEYLGFTEEDDDEFDVLIMLLVVGLVFAGGILVIGGTLFIEGVLKFEGVTIVDGEMALVDGTIGAVDEGFVLEVECTVMFDGFVVFADKVGLLVDDGTELTVGGTLFIDKGVVFVFTGLTTDGIILVEVGTEFVAGVTVLVFEELALRLAFEVTVV